MDPTDSDMIEYPDEDLTTFEAAKELLIQKKLTAGNFDPYLRLLEPRAYRRHMASAPGRLLLPAKASVVLPRSLVWSSCEAPWHPR